MLYVLNLWNMLYFLIQNNWVVEIPKFNEHKHKYDVCQ